MERPSSVFYRLLEEIGMKRFYIALCTLLAIVAPSCTPEAQDDQAGISGGSQTEEPKDEPVPLSAEFKVMSFNVKVDGTNDATTVNGWGSRKQVCVQMIRKYLPAIIGLQEANCTNQWLWLKNELKDRYDGYGVNRDNAQESGSGEVMGILYDREILEKIDCGTFWLSETPDQVSKSWNSACNRTATWATFIHKESGIRFCYINTHLDHESVDARINGMGVIKKRFQMYNPQRWPQILTGDFNTTSDNAAFLHISGTMKNTRSAAPSELTDSHTTYNGWKEDKQSIIDHIYVSNEVEVLEYHTIYEKYGDCPFISDHYPIISHIRIN